MSKAPSPVTRSVPPSLERCTRTPRERACPNSAFSASTPLPLPTHQRGRSCAWWTREKVVPVASLFSWIGVWFYPRDSGSGNSFNLGVIFLGVTAVEIGSDGCTRTTPCPKRIPNGILRSPNSTAFASWARVTTLDTYAGCSSPPLRVWLE
jgi:hypothetical protein